MNFATVNMKKDPNYRPYCVRCPGLVRMERVDKVEAVCRKCGAVHLAIRPLSHAEKRLL